ncbi:microtubule-associated proteins 1A/1B light chain 3A-like [Prorops nasuta]|uniref:microtubule-associated proteins 1A/1B light chain 3A-like n=1 Tax=Prorops nasuta TaxID=863751 RepID=UPI0034CDCB20
MNRLPKRYKEKRPFAMRVAEVNAVREKYPDRIPIIVERYTGEKYLPIMGKIKFLVPDFLSVAELTRIIRLKLQLHPNQAIFLLVNQRCMASGSMTLAQLYQQEKDEDGYLYILFASQETFGH